MFTNMVSAISIVEAGLGLYLILGSTSWGYMLMRIGWPNIRAIGIEYKSGWSIVFGLIFTSLVIISSYGASQLAITKMSLLELIALNSIIVFFAGMIIFTIKRKLLGGKHIKVSIPKRVVSANVVAKKAVEKLPKTSYIKVSKEGALKLSQLRHKLEMADIQEDKQQAEPIKTKKSLGVIIRAEQNQKQREKEVQKIIGSLERNVQKKKIPFSTRSELEEKVKKSEQYIKSNIEEKIGDELKKEMLTDKEKKAQKLQKTMPRSATLLKELLKETQSDDDE